MSVYDIFPVKELSGDIVTFADGADGIPMESLSAVITPTQDLHGYDHPWPAGGGVNKYDMANWGRGTQRFWGTDASSMVSVLNTLSAGTYTITAKIKVETLTDTSGNRTYGFLCTGVSVDARQTIPTPAVGSTISVSKTFTLAAGNVGAFTHCYWYAGTSTSTSDTATISEIGINVGSDDTYIPYSNICPISGLTGLSMYRTWKNLVDPSKKVATSTTTAKWYNDGTGFLLHGGQAYALSSNISTDATYFVYIYDMGGTQLAYGKWTATYTPTNDTYVYLQYYESGGAHLSDAQLQLELGSTATTYEPYNGNTYSVDLSTQAGTVYHGTVDPVAGQLTVDWTYKEFNGTEAWSAASNYLALFGQQPSKSNTDMSQKSNVFVAGGNGYADYNKFRAQANGAIVVGNKKEDGTVGRWADATAFKSFLAELYSEGTPFAVCYELATPVTYQLTPQEITTLLGLNNVWATVAPITVEYHAQAQTENVRIDSLFVDGVDMQADGWFLKWRKLAAPKPKTDYISVWGRDGDIDLTENESDGQVFYENRELTMDMVYIGEDWTNAYSELLDKLHGKDCIVQFTSDPYWYWAGRVVASLFEHKPHSLTMNGIMFPYKLSVSKNTASATVSGATEETATEVVLQGSRMRVSPKVTVTGESITLKWGNKTQTLSAGTYYVRGLKVGSDDVTIKVYGTGTVNFEYRKGML